MAERFEPMDVERNVVVHQKNGAGPVVAGVADVGKNSLEGVGVKVVAPHFDDRAETAVVGAAAGGLDNIDLAAQQGVASKDASVAIGQADFVIFQLVHWSIGVMEPAIIVAAIGVPIRKATDALKASTPL